MKHPWSWAKALITFLLLASLASASADTSANRFLTRSALLQRIASSRRTANGAVPFRPKMSCGSVVSEDGGFGISANNVWKAPTGGSSFAKREKGLEGLKLTELQIGMELRGRIVAMKPFGAFVDVGCEKDGLLPSRELQKKFGENFPGNDQLLDVTVAEVDLDNSRFRLMIKGPKPKLEADHLSEGDIVKGKVKHLASFGAFIDVGAGKDGLLHNTWLKSVSFADGVTIGEEIEVSIQRIDKENNKIILGAPGKQEGDQVRQERPERPKQDLERYRQAINNQKFKATVISLKPYGAILALEDGVRGLLPLRFASSDRIQSVSEVLDVGDKIDVYVLGIDDRGISFSRRPISGSGPRSRSDRGRSPNKKVSSTVSAGGVTINIGKEVDKFLGETSDKPSVASASTPVGVPATQSESFVEQIKKDNTEDDDEVEVEERVYNGKIYLVDPSTNELYTEEGEVVGEWEGDEPIFF